MSVGTRFKQWKGGVASRRKCYLVGRLNTSSVNEEKIVSVTRRPIVFLPFLIIVFPFSEHLLSLPTHAEA